MKFLASLTNRIFLASSLLAVISIAAAILVVNARVTRDAEAGLQRQLRDAATLVAEWRTTLSGNFLLAARLIADTPKLKAAVDTGDAMTVQPLAEEYRRQVSSDVFIVCDRLGRPLASSPGAIEPPSASVAEALLGRESVWYRPHPDGVLELVTVPIALGPQVIGSLSVGFLFDRRRAEQFKRATETEVAFAIDGRVAAGSLPDEVLGSLAGLLREPRTEMLSLNGNDYLGMVRPLAAGVSRSGEASSRPSVLLLQSRSDRLRFLRGIHTALGGTALVALLGAILLSYLVARTVTRPLAAITNGMREMAATGDLTRKIALPAGNRDEDAELLAGTFNRLVDSVTRFQREARQRERLSALGRLSTVIAHEIRNPLMIIKAAVRTLRRESTNQQEVQQAAADIGEEVDRLNRIVGEVLDFARPIRFTYGEADLAALCAQSATAAAAGESFPAVRVSARGPVPAITDAERLRAVLVNLVTNARQAVIGAHPGEPRPRDEAAPDVEVRLDAAPGGDRVRIEVADRGPGIPPDVLPRVFDPYFSTRREGTGLGLAIARNVIDGLDGTIALTSEPGAGTCVVIDLPRIPDAAREGGHRL
jgi:two-component system, NtrC family, sensor histidine kinase HydH